jgi:hypothetical protein
MRNERICYHQLLVIQKWRVYHCKKCGSDSHNNAAKLPQILENLHAKIRNLKLGAYVIGCDPI